MLQHRILSESVFAGPGSSCNLVFARGKTPPSTSRTQVGTRSLLKARPELSKLSCNPSRRSSRWLFGFSWLLFCRSPTSFCDLRPAHPVLPDFVEVSGLPHTSYVLRSTFADWLRSSLGIGKVSDPRTAGPREPHSSDIARRFVSSRVAPNQQPPHEVSSCGAVTRQ